MTIDFTAINKKVAEGYINLQEHPSADLRIYNYSQKAQFDWHWTPETMICRGLIVNGRDEIVARPFPKFFSYEQLNGQVPVEPFEVYEKLDGSLGILYWVGDEPRIATRGSFVSEQAQKATEIFRARYSHLSFDQRLTYLFEIIYPENRIVVDYGDTEELFLLAVIETATGHELPSPDIGVPLVRRYDCINDFRELLTMQERNREGFVVRFQSGQRVKLKFDEYKRLHKLLTGVTARHIWEDMRDGRDISEIIDRVPDEYFAWVQDIRNGLREQYAQIEAQAQADFKALESRKETALYFQTCANPGLLFAMLDGKDYSHRIWKLIRPSGEKAFRRDIDT
ncbi:MAG: T4 RnlA family RNA ligase [Blastocatellia bacterium]|nr:T4 RnlA family RNA ligase [Blastocatellia bacterium]